MGSVTEELEAVVASVRERTGSSVVGVEGRRAVGSGFVVADGLVVTNAHNTRADTVTVTFADGASRPGTVRGFDADGDLAVVAVDTGGAAALRLAGAASPARPGQVVVALSRPGRGGLHSALGQVSAVEQAFRGPRGRHVRGAVEHTAPAPRGSSGGPVLAEDGTVVGVNTHRLGEGFYLAVAADETLSSRIDALAGGARPSRPRLGVSVAPSSVARRLRRAVGLPERDGLLVRGVRPGGPADRAGVREGDLLVAAAGTPLVRADDLFDVLDGLGADATVEVAVVRGETERTLTVSLAASAEAGAEAEAGAPDATPSGDDASASPEGEGDSRPA